MESWCGWLVGASRWSLTYPAHEKSHGPDPIDGEQKHKHNRDLCSGDGVVVGGEEERLVRCVLGAILCACVVERRL